ncbi:hypothetical protein Godav_029981, partial [Gossypium davidsonii]|nr:hypothetical protein [Gossypium davidsonii]
KGKSRDSSEVRSVSGNDHFKGFKVCCVGGRGEEIRANNHVASELNGAGVFEENSVMLLTRNETMVEGKKGVISLIRKVIDATGGKVGVRRRDVRVKVGFVSKKNAGGSRMGVLLGHMGNDGVLGQENFESISLKPNLDKLKHTTFWVIEIDSHGTRSRKENNLFNFRAMGKEILGERSIGILEDSLNMRKPPDGKLGYNGQPTLDLSSVMEAIVGNLHQDLRVAECGVPFIGKGGFRDDGVINKLRYSNSCRIEANGFSGGIWVFWNDNINVKILGLHYQAIHIPLRNNRHMLWDYLNSMVESCDEPWLIAGDFDSILNMSKKRGDATTFRNGCAHFQEFLFNNGLRELGYCESRFTWRLRNYHWQVELLNEFGNWDWTYLRSFLPNPIVIQIALLLPSSLDAGND